MVPEPREQEVRGPANAPRWWVYVNDVPQEGPYEQADSRTASPSGSAGLFGPLGDVGPVPGGASADRPSGFGEQPPVSPHRDGVALDAETDGDVVAADGVARFGHGSIMECNARIDKCNARSYNRDMTKHTFTDRTVANGDDHEYKTEVFHSLTHRVGSEGALLLMDKADAAIVEGWRANCAVALLCDAIVDHLVLGESHPAEYYRRTA